MRIRKAAMFTTAVVIAALSVAVVSGCAANTMVNSVGDENIVHTSSGTDGYANVIFKKTGDSTRNENADFDGSNAALLADKTGRIELDNVTIDTDGAYASGLYACDDGTASIKNSKITTHNDYSGGVMVTNGGQITAADLEIETEGTSSAAIRSDRGGGVIEVEGGSYTTQGMGSPVIYSTADITLKNATCTANSAQGVIVEGSNSVTLENVNLTVNNTSQFHPTKTDEFQAVMLYQSMGIIQTSERRAGVIPVQYAAEVPEEYAGHFSMKGGSIDNTNGDVFYVTNTTANITLENVEIENNEYGRFLLAEAAGWGTEGWKGGQVDVHAISQKIEGDIEVDADSNVSLFLDGSSSFTGCVYASDGTAPNVYVGIEEGGKWTLTGDAQVASLSCPVGSIDLSGHKLYVNGVEYDPSVASGGEPMMKKYTENRWEPWANRTGYASDGPDLPDDFDPSQMPENFDFSQMPEGAEVPDGFDLPEGVESPNASSSSASSASA